MAKEISIMFDRKKACRQEFYKVIECFYPPAMARLKRDSKAFVEVLR